MVRPLAAREKGPRFDSSIAQQVQILISWAFTQGTAIELILGPTTRAHLLPVHLNLIITLSKGYARTICQLTKAIHLSGLVNGYWQ